MKHVCHCMSGTTLLAWDCAIALQGTRRSRHWFNTHIQAGTPAVGESARRVKSNRTRVADVREKWQKFFM